jgi:hypothetical protein
LPLYEFDCENKKCMKKGKPHEFTDNLKVAEMKAGKKPKCPKCNNSKNVKKVIRTAFPKSQSWGM